MKMQLRKISAIAIMLVLLVFAHSSFAEPVTFANPDVQYDFEIVEHTWNTKYYHYLGMSIQNNTADDLDIKVSALFYDISGVPVGVDDTNMYAVEAGGAVFCTLYTNKEFATYEYTMTTKKSMYGAVLSSISYQANTSGNKAIVIAENKGPTAAKFTKCTVLFLDGGRAVGYADGYLTDSDNELKPGGRQFEEFKCSNKFDTIEVYFEARADK
ncbi:hypothetical protein FACS18948_6990 [Clostridia bacterium]|nr:hypothetical protein FACS18948_6990 [Clostridia bacterium]